MSSAKPHLISIHLFSNHSSCDPMSRSSYSPYIFLKTTPSFFKVLKPARAGLEVGSTQCHCQFFCITNSPLGGISLSGIFDPLCKCCLHPTWFAWFFPPLSLSLRLWDNIDHGMPNFWAASLAGLGKTIVGLQVVVFFIYRKCLFPARSTLTKLDFFFLYTGIKLYTHYAPNKVRCDQIQNSFIGLLHVIALDYRITCSQLVPKWFLSAEYLAWLV